MDMKPKEKSVYDIFSYVTQVIDGKIKHLDPGEETKEYQKKFEKFRKIWEMESPDLWEIFKQKRKIIEEENFNKTSEKTDKKSEVGSEKRGEAGSVPRTYSMGAQPPSLNQPLDGRTNNSILFLTNEKYEDEYFAHLSNVETDDEQENYANKDFFDTEKVLEKYKKQKHLEICHTDEQIDNLQEIKYTYSSDDENTYSPDDENTYKQKSFNTSNVTLSWRQEPQSGCEMCGISKQIILS
ncbi:hypothetical protein JTB14_021729 [Gonioctena quinquepunctata]|nr:hypothetical protein JTB14_021729 [Gonioctena quinquepunctata]